MENKPEITDASGEQLLSLCDVLNFFDRIKWVVLSVFLGVGLLAALYAMRLPDIYTATTKIIPMQQVPQVQQVLESGVVLDALVKRFALMQAYGVKSVGEARDRLAKATQIKQSKEGVFSISVDDLDAARAAGLASAYPEELDGQIGLLGLSDKTKQRIVFEVKLNSAKSELVLAQDELKRVAAELKDRSRQLSFEEEVIDSLVPLKVALDFLSEANPVMIISRQDVERLYGQLEELLKSANNPARQVKSRAERDYLSKYAQVKYLHAKFESLKSRYQSFKDEERIYASAVIDPAMVPERPAKPKRAAIVLLVALAAALLSILVALLRDFWLGRRLGATG